MVTIKSFQEIKAWQKAHELVLEIYAVSKTFPKEELFCLTNQLRRAVISIAANIAEGFKRKSYKDSDHFYTISVGSLEEVKYYLILGEDLDYLTRSQYEKLFALAEETSKTLNGWKKSQNNYY